ncbi:MAG: hypothetical protein HRU28_02455 [Rhizobiales bacterium]|nr:hypothetical protein [Hyphomicrobiales bacterium]
MHGNLNKYLFKHSNLIYYYQRRTPKHVLEKNPTLKKKEMISLKTKDHKTALLKAERINQRVVEEWDHYFANGCGTELYAKAIKKSQDLNIKYIHADELASLDKFEDLVSRINYLEENKFLPDSLTSLTALGAVDKPQVLLKDVLEIYFEEIKAENKKIKTDDQYRIWKNPKIKAVQNFDSINGEIDFYQINRAHVMKLRSLWLERILNDEVKGNTAKKDFNNLSVICSDYANHIGDFNYNNPFKNVHFDNTEDDIRPPFDNETIDDMLNNTVFLKLNFEARMAFFASLDTGARPNEIARLKKEHIFLDTAIPYISIEPSKDKRLKTKQSKRTIPLVGIALEVFKTCPNGFPKYFHKEGTLCQTINKFLKINGFKSTPLHAFTSLRHSFTDRMEEAGMGEEFRHRMTGHTNKHVVYGRGGTLEFQHSQLKKIERPFSSFLFEFDADF